MNEKATHFLVVSTETEEAFKALAVSFYSVFIEKSADFVNFSVCITSLIPMNSAHYPNESALF